MPDLKDLLWIEDAARNYNRSRSWMQKQVDEGRLSYVQIPGDRKLYLLKGELDAMFSIQPQRKDGTTDEE